MPEKSLSYCVPGFFLMVVDFSVDSCFGGWNVLWTLFKYIWLWTLFKYIRENVKKSFWHWIQLLLDRWLYRWSALSPKNTWQLSWCLWDVRQYGAAGALCSTAGGIIHFSLEITPVIHHSKLLKTTECDYWRGIIVTVRNNTLTYYLARPEQIDYKSTYFIKYSFLLQQHGKQL